MRMRSVCLHALQKACGNKLVLRFIEGTRMRVRVQMLKKMAHGHLSRSVSLCVDVCADACVEGNCPRSDRSM